MENVVQQLNSRKYDESLVALIAKLNSSLKIHGAKLETFYKDQFDKAQVYF